MGLLIACELQHCTYSASQPSRCTNNCFYLLPTSRRAHSIMALTTGTFGFPRIGDKRQIKAALERYWRGAITKTELYDVYYTVEKHAWMLQKNNGVARIGLDGTLYDQVLDATFILGLAPSRFQDLSGLDQYFAMARGTPKAPALDMSKFLDTNYHYLVPELSKDFKPSPSFSLLLDKLARGQEVLGKDDAIPMIIGPITFVLLANTELPLGEAVERLLPTYCQLLRALQVAGAPEVQLHEPILVTDKGAAAEEVTTAAYQQLAAVGCPIHLVTYYDDLGDAYPWVVRLPVATVSLDFVGVPGSTAGNDTLALIKKHGFPAGKRLGAGLIDARSVWRDDIVAAAGIVSELHAAGITNIVLQPSTTLQHLPYDVTAEQGTLEPSLLGRLAFAVQKLGSLKELAELVAGGGPINPPAVKPVSDPTSNLERGLFSRPQPYAQRRPLQPTFQPFPTTTIGSFPQTAEVRRLRAQLRSGALTQQQYETLIDQQIAYAIGIQDALGLDVLVHGEAERTDMVEYFGAQLGGLAFTTAGWVQSYGSRYVRPPIIVGDVEFQGAMTVREFKVAQALTSRPVKGMLTGPVTILNWSFPRKDLSRAAQALQLALALRQEVDALQQAGCRIIQVDEPALREGLPLKDSRKEAYLAWAVDAFRLCTSVAAPEVQLVTHLCYSDFNDIMAAVDNMDADVLTIENSRSGDEMVRALVGANYGKDVGPGVYDVHSPVVPTVEFMTEKVKTFIAAGLLKGDFTRTWLNPDCGLKTRRWEEVIPSLANMVAAAAALRKAAASAEASALTPAAGAAASIQVPARACGVGCC